MINQVLSLILALQCARQGATPPKAKESRLPLTYAIGEFYDGGTQWIEVDGEEIALYQFISDDDKVYQLLSEAQIGGQVYEDEKYILIYYQDQVIAVRGKKYLP